MKTNGKITKIAIAAVAAGAMALPATGAFAADKTERAVIGALIGGVAGAALYHGDGGATAIGAVAGAALGATTSNDRYHRSYRETRPYYRDTQYRHYDRGSYGRNDYGRYDTRYDYGRDNDGYGYGYRR